MLVLSLVISQNESDGTLFTSEEGKEKCKIPKKLYSINKLVSLLGGDETQIPKRPGEPDCTFTDSYKIFLALGCKPKVRFEQGVQVMFDKSEKWREASLWDENSISEATEDWFAYLVRRG
jgi:UDP-glucose 4-epimerase